MRRRFKNKASFLLRIFEEGGQALNEQQGDYFYGSEAEQYTFYRLPKVLFSDTRYKGISDGAKILYGLMLDRMGLSIKNGWMDEYNRVYIYFTLEDVLEYMNCKQDKGVKMLAELDTEKGVGLIERVKRGQGKPAIIYLKKFIRSPEVLTTEKPKSALRKSRSLDFGKTDPNDNKYNNNYISNTECQSIYPSDALIDRTDQTGVYRSLFIENIGYHHLCGQYGRDRLDEILDVLLDAVCSTKQHLRVDGEDKPAEIVKSRLLKLDSSHIEYCFDRLDQNTTKIRNIKAYLLTTLYNAPATISHHYRAEVQHELYCEP